MNRLARILRRNLRTDERGDVLMEYVVVCGIIGIGIVSFLRKEFYDFDNGYVGMGLSIQKAFQRVLEGISLPVP